MTPISSSRIGGPLPAQPTTTPRSPGSRSRSVVILRYLLDEDPRRQVGGDGDARRPDADDHAALVADDAEHGSLADADVAKPPNRELTQGEEADLDGWPLWNGAEREGGAAGSSSGACHGARPRGFIVRANQQWLTILKIIFK